MEEFELLIGTWVTEATHPSLDGAASGEVTFEWLTGRRFVIERSVNDHDQVPDGIAVIGPPEVGDGLVKEYFDSRGVRRTYHVSLRGGVLRQWRDAEGFDQRFEAALAPDRFTGRWQLAREPGEWRDDLLVEYRRSR